MGQDYQRYYREGNAAAQAAAQQNWANLSARQKSLDRAIASIYQQQKVPLTDQGVDAVMEAIGAEESERGYVQNRMYWHYQAQTALGH